MLPKEKRTAVFLPLVSFFWFSFYAYSPVFTEYVRGFSTSQMAGTIIASYGFMQMLLRIPVGILSDRLKTRKLFITIGAALGGVAAIGLAFFPSPGMALLFRALSGVAVSTWVPFSILFSSYFQKEHAARAMGIINAFNFGGQMVATLLGGYIADLMGSVKWAFFLSAGAAAVAAVLSLFIIDQDKSDFGSQKTSVREVLRVGKDKKLLLAALLSLLTQFAAFATIYGFTPTFAKANIGVTSTQLGIMTTLVTLPAIFSSALAAKFSRLVKGMNNSVAVTFLITAVYAVFVPYIKNLYLLYAAQFFFGFARGISTSVLMGYAIESIVPERRSTAMGFYQAIYGIGMTFGPQVVGLFGRSGVGEVNLAGLTTGFFAVAAIQLAGMVVALIMMRKDAAKSGHRRSQPSIQ
jgi:MFS family permease